MDSPLEALVLNCAGVNLGFILRSFWSWLAVVAAAVSFWRVRTVKPNLMGSDPDPVPAHHHPEKPEEAKSRPQPETEEQYSEQEPIASTSGEREREEDLHVEMVTKGNRYKACYDYQMKESGEGDWQMVVEQWGGRRKEMELQQVGMNNVGMMREMGWYRYQDLKVLDGSVVRLWDNYAGFCTRRR